MPVLIRNALQQSIVQIETALNIALASNGGVATASDTYSGGYPPEAANNGDRKGLNWGSGGGWNSVGLPAWLQIAWTRPQNIDRIDVFHLQDAYGTPIEPNLSTQFTLYGNVNFVIEYWNGTVWAAVSGGTVTGNNKVWRQFLFPPITTSKIRAYVTGNTGVDSYARIVEMEAYSTTGWSPSVLTSAIARYKADQMTGLADTEPVSVWEDIIGPYDATAAGSLRPVYRSGGGAPYVSFDGSNKELLTSITNNFGDFAVFVVFRWPSPSPYHARIVDKNYITGFWMGHQANQANAGGGIMDGPPYGHFLPGVAGDWHALLFQRSGTTKTIHMDGLTETQTVTDALCDSTPLRIGRDHTLAPDSCDEIDFKEIVVFDDNIAGKNLSTLVKYAEVEYGLVL